MTRADKALVIAGLVTFALALSAAITAGIFIAAEGWS